MQALSVRRLALSMALVALLSSAASATPTYDIVFIGTQIDGATAGTATAVNEGGDVAGYVAFESFWEHTPFIYTTELGPILLPRPAWAVTARALDLSDRKANGTIEVVGWGANSIYSGDLALAWTISTVDGTVLEMVELGTLNGLPQSQAKAVNDVGDRVGYSAGFMQFGGPATHFAPDGPAQLSNLYTAVAVNESRQVLAANSWESSLFDLSSGAQQDLGRPAGSFNGALGMALNDVGQVVAQVSTGDSDPHGQFIKQVWRFTDELGWEYLFGGGNALDNAFGMNNHGDVVGKVLSGLTHVDVLYLEGSGTSHQIETLFSPDAQGVEVYELNDINDAGQIATSGPGGPVLLVPAVATTAVREQSGMLSTIHLSNHPNPFNPRTTIRFEIPVAAAVTLRVYDAGGRLIRHLVDRSYEAGIHSVAWDGRDDRGTATSSGVYFYHLDASGEQLTRRMVLIE